MNHLVWIFKEVIYLGASASILILIILLTKRIFKKAISPKWHYYIWILLVIRLLVPFAPESSLSIYTIFYTAAEKVNIPVSELNNPLQDSTLGEGEADIIAARPQAPADDNENTANSGITGTGLAAAFNNAEVPKYNLAIIIMAFLWLFVVLLLTFYTICINIVFAVKVKKNYTLIKDERINGILRDCKNRMKIKKPIVLLSSKKVRTPSLYVLIKPKILVAKAYMDQLSDAEIEYIFLHELSHYKRKDIAVNWILALLQIVYFFNPLIWYAFYKIHEDCEISCDAEALRYIKEEEYQSYGSTIIKLIRLFSESNFIPATAGIGKNKSSYKRRIIMISKFKKSKWTSTLLTVILITIVALAGLTGCKKSSDANTNNTADSTETNENNDQSNTDTADQTQSKDNTADTAQSGSNTADADKDQSASTDQNSVAYYGDWVINKVLAYGSTGTYSSEDAESLVGKSLSFSADQANSFGDDPTYIDKIVSDPVYTETIITNNDFVTNYRMTFDNLGIKADSISEINVTDAEENACTFLVKDENTLILTGGGTYFELIRKAE